MHGVGKLLAQCLRKEEEDQESANEGASPHDEERQRSPDCVEHGNLRSNDASNPATQRAGPHRGAPDLCREHLCGVDEHDGEAGRGSKLANQRQSNLDNKKIYDIQCNVNIITDLEPSETVSVEEASSNASDTSQQLTEAQDRFATQSVKKENGGKVSWDLKG